VGDLFRRLARAEGPGLIDNDDANADRVAASKATADPRPIPTSVVFALLALIAALPRTLIALRADLGPDEPIYLNAGRSYVRLLLAGDFANSGWLENQQHPALPKLIFGVCATIADNLLHVDPTLGARMASVLVGTLTVVAIFGLGRRTFGYWPALLAAITLAVSPWHVYWSSLALLDLFLVFFLTLAVLLALQADRHPGWMILASISFGLAFASKYSAALGLPALCILCLISMNRRRRSHWIVAAACPLVSAATVLIADPSIWADPWNRIFASVTWQLNRAAVGHLAFYAGQTMSHTPWWVASYIVVIKNSVTIVGFALLLVLSLPGAIRIRGLVKTPSIVAITWFALLLLGFSFLPIVVADNYVVPMAPPVVMGAAMGCVETVRMIKTRLRFKAFTLHSWCGLC
jgi:4-amino-4-deoxy-L-arabinose transferase-like glycosyltransferase